MRWWGLRGRLMSRLRIRILIGWRKWRKLSIWIPVRVLSKRISIMRLGSCLYQVPGFMRLISVLRNRWKRGKLIEASNRIRWIRKCQIKEFQMIKPSSSQSLRPESDNSKEAWAEIPNLNPPNQNHRHPTKTSPSKQRAHTNKTSQQLSQAIKPQDFNKGQSSPKAHISWLNKI